MPLVGMHRGINRVCAGKPNLPSGSPEGFSQAASDYQGEEVFIDTTKRDGGDEEEPSGWAEESRPRKLDMDL